MRDIGKSYVTRDSAPVRRPFPRANHATSCIRDVLPASSQFSWPPAMQNATRKPGPRLPERLSGIQEIKQPLSLNRTVIYGSRSVADSLRNIFLAWGASSCFSFAVVTNS